MDNYRAIENLIYSYAELIDSGKLEDVAQLFSHARFLAPDGKVVASGAEEFLQLQCQSVKIYADTGTPCTRHVTTNVIIEVNDTEDHATARSYFTVFQATDELPLQAIISGRYKDSFERVDNQWRFTQRQTLPDLLGDLSCHLLFDIRDSQS